MLRLDRVTLRLGSEPLLTDASMQLHAGWRVGVIGRNGCGKSSLFKLLLGEISADAGDVIFPPGTRMAHMAQEAARGGDSALDYVMAGDSELVELQRGIEAAEAAQDGQRLAHLHGELDAIDGYTAPARAEQLLAGLGFPASVMQEPISHFSGGWRVRLDLARALMRRSDVLLLDEPTNHLDVDAVIWLEQWLKQYPGTLLLISHDRDFLDNVVGHVIHFDQGTLVQYRGNYSAFERQRAERMAQQQAAFEKQQQRVREIEQFVARFRAKASKARQAQSRLKELERMEEIAPAHIDSPFRFEFPAAEKTSNPLLHLRAVDAGYAPGEPVLHEVGLSLLPGERIGLLGANGAGKSTLIRTMTGELPLLAGDRTPGEHLAIGYFAQHQLDDLTPEWSALEHLRREHRGARDQELRNFLGGFGFPGDQALAQVDQFSGGEKARLALARIAWRRPNLLLLDEPTNHLDLDMRHALDLALQSFAGAVVLVTHDRHLLRDSVDEFWLIADGRVQPFDGDLDDYARWLRERKTVSPGNEKTVTTGGKAATPAATAAGTEQASATSATSPQATRDRKNERKQAARAREALKPLRQEVGRIEKQLDKHQQELARIEEKLADTSLYDPEHQGDLQALLRRQADLADTVEKLEAQWLEAAEKLEAAQ